MDTGGSLQFDDGFVSVSMATHRCFWTGCDRQSFGSRDDLVSHIESVHVDGPRSSSHGAGDVSERQRRPPRRRWRDGHVTAGAFYCGWLDCPRRRRPFNARYKLLIHTRVHNGRQTSHVHGICFVFVTA